MMRRSASSTSSSEVRPSGLKPLSAMSWAASISLRAGIVCAATTTAAPPTKSPSIMPKISEIPAD